jgi:ribosome modulation factor
MADLIIDHEAWAAGFAAGEAGKPLTACPYPARSPESLSWHSGFIEGNAKREWNERGNCLKPRP